MWLSKLTSCIVLPCVFCMAAPAWGAVTFLNSWGSQGSGNGQFYFAKDVTVAPNGLVYVTDAANYRIQRFDADGNYDLQWGSYGTGNGQFDTPHSVAVAPNGQVYVTDEFNHRVQRFDADGNYQTEWSSGIWDSAGDQFNYPTGIAVAPDGSVYVSDSENNRIVKFDADGNYQIMWGSLGAGPGQFNLPAGMDVAANGQPYVADYYNNRIQRFDADGNYQGQWGSEGSGNGQFGYPCDVAIGSNGLAYVADIENHRIQRFDADGNYQTKWGEMGTGDGQFFYPSSVAVTPTGLVYVSDYGNHRIQRFFDPDAWDLQDLIVNHDQPSGDDFNIVGGMDVDVPGHVTVASTDAATLTVKDSGSLATDGRLLVGQSAAGTMSISGGGTVTTGTYSEIGRSSPSESSVTVTGSDSSWHTGDGNFWVGKSSPARLTIEDQATVTTGSIAFVGFSTGAAAEITVKDSGSIWRIGGTCFLGGDTTGAGDTALLSVEDGGEVSITDRLKLWSTGTLRLDGGTVHAVAADLYGTVDVIGLNSHLQIDGATTLSNTLSLNGGTLSTGSLVNLENLQFNSGTLNVTGDLTVGSASGMEFVVSSGCAINVTNNTTVEATSELQLDDGDFSSGDLTNHGLVRGDGDIDATLTNASNGTVQAFGGKSLHFDGSAHTNHGDIELQGGTVQFTGALTNETDGSIMGNGSLIAGDGLTNTGTMSLSATTNVNGDVTNATTGLIASAGGTTTFFDTVANEGEIRTSLGSFSLFYGSIEGNGDFTGPGIVMVEGDLRPGNSPGEVHFAGNMALGSGATLEIELGSAEYDRVLVDGTLSLDGTLDVVLWDGFTPHAGDTFDILDWGELATGSEFETVNLPPLSYISWDDSLLYTTGVLSVVVIDPLPGDANLDGEVDVTDLGILATHYGMADGAEWEHADFDGDGRVNVNDLGILATHYGETAPMASVPEPAAFVLMGVGLLVLLVRNRRRGR